MRYAVVALFLALSVASLPAQMRGRPHGPSVSFRGHGGFRGGPHFRGHGFAGPRFFPRRHFFGGHRFHTRPFFGATVVFGGYGYPYYPYYSSYVGVPVYASSEYRRDDYQTEQLSRQLYDLSSEVRQLREQNDQLRYDLERRYASPPQSETEPEAQRPLRARPDSRAETRSVGPPTVIVLEDGRRLETRSYAITGQTLWILSPDRAQKIPLSQLNVDETRKANAARGLEFVVP